MAAVSPDRHELARFLTAIGEPKRLEIVQLLVDGGPRNVGEIVAAFELSRAAIGHHLRVLRDAGVLRTERKAQEIHHEVACDHVAGRLRAIAVAVSSCPPTS